MGQIAGLDAAAALEVAGRELWDDLYGLVGVYVLVVGVLRRWGPWAQRADGQPPEVSSLWKPLMAAYNLIMSVFSFLAASGMVYSVFVTQNGEFKGPDCKRFAQDELFVQISYLFYLSKYVEFMDTLFLIVKGKQVTWLHFLHHCGAALNMGMLYHSKMEAIFIFIVLNGYIHTIMYAYFGLALLGIRLKGKHHITTLQILQFLTGFYIFYDYKDIPCFRDSPSLMVTYYYTWTYVGFVLLMFLHFFVTSYLWKPTKKTAKQE
mmetsp:Transcript_11275/g.19889  ORF Transcript_11275/g.19889 Transcript_11275/m.19889 type:complete len:263 (-) Transcript_11275:1993-2781(-)